jgi:hypothetical protein
MNKRDTIRKLKELEKELIQLNKIERESAIIRAYEKHDHFQASRKIYDKIEILNPTLRVDK